jgi:hypothetical protein
MDFSRKPTRISRRWHRWRRLRKLTDRLCFLPWRFRSWVVLWERVYWYATLHEAVRR